jgi:hypothetical protein
MDKSESEVFDECRADLDILQRLGIIFWKRIYMGGRLHRGKMVKNPNAGMPDLVVFHRGRCAFIELKKPKGGVFSKEQIEFKGQCERQGIFWASARSRSEMRHALREFGLPMNWD